MFICNMTMLSRKLRLDVDGPNNIEKPYKLSLILLDPEMAKEDLRLAIRNVG